MGGTAQMCVQIDGGAKKGLFDQKQERLHLVHLDFYEFALKLAAYGLTDRELKTMLFRKYCKLSLRETGKILNGKISYEAVRLIEKGAIKKIKIILTKRKSNCIL